MNNYIIHIYIYFFKKQKKHIYIKYFILRNKEENER